MQKCSKAMLRENPDPPPFDGKVVVKDGGKNNSLVQVFNKAGKVVFRRECKITSKYVALQTDQRGWFLLRSVVGLDLVIEITSPNQDFRLNVETGETNQKFWFEGGFLRNRAYPGKVVAMVEQDTRSGIRSSGNLPFSLQLVDAVEGTAKQYWIYNKGNKTFENGYLNGTDRCVIEIFDALYKPKTPIIVNKLSTQARQKFTMEPDPSGGEVEVTNISYDLKSAESAITPSTIYSLTNRNNSPVANTIEIDQDEISSTKTSAVFYWENELVVRADTTFITGIPEVVGAGKIGISVEEKYVVGSNSKTENTTEKKWSFNTPITVPAHSEVDFELIVRDGQLDVPFTATVRRGIDEWEENGVFKGVNCLNLDVSIDVKELGSDSSSRYVLDVGKLSSMLQGK